MPELETEQTFQILRGQAIGAYTVIELNLCKLFHHLLQTDLEAAGIAFYAVKNAHGRNKLVKDLLERRHGKAYSHFWNSWNKKCQKVDERRNSIAHWIMSTTRTVIDAVPQPPRTSLKHPTYRTKGDWHPISALSEQDLKNFIEECEDLAYIIRLFHGYLTGDDLHGHERQTLDDIFKLPISYPPPSDSPLCRNYKKPKTPSPAPQA